MTVKTRIKALENADKGHAQGKVFTLYSGPGTDDPDGKKLAEIRAQASPEDTIIIIRYQEGKPENPLSTITLGDYERTIGIDAGKV